jgi:ABC-type polysaccharide/polyol phosphate export permease
MTNRIQVYEPDSHKKQGFFKAWFVMIHNLIQYRELIFQLFVRDFLGGFKKSIFGIGWLFISPILGVVSWVFYDSTGILQPGDVGVPYPAYVLLGSMIYGLFMGFYTAATGTIEAGGGFIMQVNYPHEILLFKQVAQYLAGFVISFVSNVAVLAVFGIMPSWYILLFPLLVLPLFFLGSSIGLLVAVASVVSNDIRKIVDIGLSLVQVITPIVYSSDITNQTLLELVKWNPLTYLISNVRDMIFFGKMTSPEGYLISSLLSVLAFLFCWRLFYVSEQRVIEKRLSL